jgi:hypothetical protein
MIDVVEGIFRGQIAFELLDEFFIAHRKSQESKCRDSRLGCPPGAAPQVLTILQPFICPRR